MPSCREGNVYITYNISPRLKYLCSINRIGNMKSYKSAVRCDHRPLPWTLKEGWAVVLCWFLPLLQSRCRTAELEFTSSTAEVVFYVRRKWAREAWSSKCDMEVTCPNALVSRFQNTLVAICSSVLCYLVVTCWFRLSSAAFFLLMTGISVKSILQTCWQS